MNILIRPLQESDLARADYIFRLAFGTFLGVSDPSQAFGDRSYMQRWSTDPKAAFKAELDGQLIGSNFAFTWGSFGGFGPLTVHPDYWGKGVAQQLIEPTLDYLQQQGIQQAGFMTFPNSPMHVHLYQKFGFWPRFLTALMCKTVQPAQPNPTMQGIRYSELSEPERVECLHACRTLTDQIYPGLDLEREIVAVATYHLGDTILLWDDAQLSAFAVCHCGSNTEAGSQSTYIKFGAVRPVQRAAQIFGQLLNACENFCLSMGSSQLLAGVNTSRQGAYQQLLDYGLRTERLGLAMHKPNEPGHNRADVFVIDDWR
ncbi:GNAT family N-acetyltransferase [Leptolyngbya sp. FACHB-261]|uniref:GNAT family N-acetyltransferase n=1 Tax=Leptolyngbya sp. FACHB-261 TaxID=2692806 RepID=UPI001684E2BD|nr:GNAT family N-acetyltransferase [Leptolyngbya sp. FACHB-261]MBD2101859.1 GNAT family N-acetyltransferase [Leptolyngbya sp. FACHB-261]